MLQNGKDYLLAGVGVLAVKEHKIEADRKGQRGQYA